MLAAANGGFEVYKTGLFTLGKILTDSALLTDTLVYETLCCVGACFVEYSAAMALSAPHSASTVGRHFIIHSL